MQSSVTNSALSCQQMLLQPCRMRVPPFGDPAGIKSYHAVDTYNYYFVVLWRLTIATK